MNFQSRADARPTDALCPIERRRRAPFGIAASLAVLLGGAGVVVAAIAGSIPANAPIADVASAMSAETNSDETLADAVRSATDEAANAIAASRAARLAAAPADIDAKTIELMFASPASPSISPARAPRAVDFHPLSTPPRLNPRRAARANAAVTAAEAKTAPVVAAALNIGAEAIETVPFFFEEDVAPPARSKPALSPLAIADVTRSAETVRISVKRGEAMVDTLKRAGVSVADRNAVAYAFGEHYNLRRLRPGQEFALTLGWPAKTIFQIASEGEPEPRLLALEFRADAQERVRVERGESGAFVATADAVPLTTRLYSIAGRIDGSLYLSAKEAGAPDEIIAGLADAFAYDVDFQREIFGGDEFEAIFEARYDDDGRMVAVGDILFARLNWRGRSREKGYYRFALNGDDPDFYDALGQSAKRLLMKTPIDGARLSSHFGTRRHPILGYRRAHKGVDFAAPRGTPIKAAGDGVVERADRYGSFGNYIRIRHANNYKTAYAHLNGFARGIRSGKRVRQGQIIGYVGTTGRSTGPHLHYEVHLNNVAVNPQALKIDTGKKLAGAELAAFKKVRASIDAMRAPPEAPAPLLARDDAGAAEPS